MNLIDHAKTELRKAGMFDQDSDYNGYIANSVLELIQCFSDQRHSGSSAGAVLLLFNKLIKRETLMPITSDPSEWQDVSHIAGCPLWQNIRKSNCFSNDGGKTWEEQRV